MEKLVETWLENVSWTYSSHSNILRFSSVILEGSDAGKCIGDGLVVSERKVSHIMNAR